MKAEMCACGERSTGWCVSCGAGLCRTHVATRVPLLPSGEYEPWTVGHSRRRSLTGLDARATSTLEALRDQLNDAWVCNSCLQRAEDAALAVEDLNPRSELYDSALDPLSSLLRGASVSAAKSYSESEQIAAVRAEISRGGGVDALCSSIAFAAFTTGSKFTYQWSTGLFRKERAEVVQVGMLQHWTSAGNGDRGSQEPTTFSERLVVDSDGHWLDLPQYRMSDKAPGYAVITPSESFLLTVAIRVAKGYTTDTFDTRDLWRSINLGLPAPTPLQEAVAAGHRAIRAS